MSTPKRTPVPKVEKPKAPVIPESTTQVEPDPSTTNEGNDNMKPESFFKKTITMISNNRETIKRKAIVAVGTGVGMLIASAVTDAFNRRTQIVYVPVESEPAPVQPIRTPRARKAPVTPVDDEVEGPEAE